MKKKPSNSLPPVGLCRGSPFPALRLLGALGGQCPAGPGALLVHLEDSGGGAGRGPHFAQAQHLVEYGWLAVGSSVLAVLVYIAGLMCSHMGAFRVATNLRIQAMEHIVTLPGPGRGLRQRKAAENRQRVQRSHRDLSGPPASRPGRGHCPPLRAAGAPLRL